MRADEFPVAVWCKGLRHLREFLEPAEDGVPAIADDKLPHIGDDPLAGNPVCGMVGRIEEALALRKVSQRP